MPGPMADQLSPAELAPVRERGARIGRRIEQRQASRRQIDLASYLGDLAACWALGRPVPLGGGSRRYCEDLAAWGKEPLVRAALALGEAVQRWGLADSPPAARALATARDWLRQPGEAAEQRKWKCLPRCSRPIAPTLPPR